MSTSLQQIEETYGHLLPDAMAPGRAAFEAFDERPPKEQVAEQYPRRRRRSVHQEALHLQGFSSVGAPRFELGTSSPPDCFSPRAQCGV